MSGGAHTSGGDGGGLQQGKSGGGGFGSGGEMPVVSDTRLFIGNLDTRVTEKHLIKLFSKYGQIENLNFLWNKVGPKRGLPRGYCFLTFKHAASAREAVAKLHGRKAFGRAIVVSPAHERVYNQSQSSSNSLSSAAAEENMPLDASRRIALFEMKLQQLRGDAPGPYSTQQQQQQAEQQGQKGETGKEQAAEAAAEKRRKEEEDQEEGSEETNGNDGGEDNQQSATAADKEERGKEEKGKQDEQTKEKEDKKDKKGGGAEGESTTDKSTGEPPAKQAKQA
ncbi:hypothetical protein PTSG_01419 [Salpingoeca rosetta]|uniref:Probable RNA-binding protein 18 n=1 Tax=Salpingoeca rosetta (strain ATCC 50818 / BSB-021) TaxID=946362 RepID=F2U0A5_SALR5|nr:uncharacterized protein PTSG_01419 [Salpingoeca rosetta]EGD80833.1 hypothetical protein PTSG_01419 [Salpingoeca rosetta]|eukprot:XP_004997394.1 hypothetical protein PTSG_01419 [Salpingoeca rosetta]